MCVRDLGKDLCARVCVLGLTNWRERETMRERAYMWLLVFECVYAFMHVSVTLLMLMSVCVCVCVLVCTKQIATKHKDACVSVHVGVGGCVCV